MTRMALKGATNLPSRSQEVSARLLCDIRDFGPVQPKYSHFSKLGDCYYHCHLGYHWVACWRQMKKGFFVEVYYVGSRESAQY
ncbi:MAG TPA: hypothetical protein DCP98_09090 [Sphaerochaeta sp.]|nr:hypothetical protein [Sphaerochaeta sp.]